MPSPRTRRSSCGAPGDCRFRSQDCRLSDGLIIRKGASAPDVANRIAIRERILRVDYILRKSRDPGLSRERRDDGLVRPYPGLFDQPPGERRPENSFVDEIRAEPEFAFRIEGRHLRAGP